MTAYLAFIMKPAQAQPNILSTDSIGNASTQRGLTNPRRTDETQDGAFHVTLQFEYGQVFKNAFLDFVHAIVIIVQYLFCSL